MGNARVQVKGDQDDLAGTVRALDEFVRAVPELEAEWIENRSHHRGPLPHVFMHDALAFAIEHVRDADAADRRRFAVAISRLNDSGDDELENIVAVAFFEHLVGEGPREAATLDALRPWLSRGSLETVRACETWDRENRSR